VSRILFTVLTIALLVGLSPLSNQMLSMPGMEMDTMSSPDQDNIAHESADDHSTSSCCDAITPCVLVIDLLFPQFATIALYGDRERVASSALTIQSIYIKNLSPPPKA
jgi:hypothetical protein